MSKPPSLRKKGKAPADPRQLTRYLTELGGDVVVDRNGDSMTRDEALARALWDMALGGIEETTEGEKVYRRPDKSVAIFIMERREGRTPVTGPVDEGARISAAEKIDELAKARINAEADSLIPVSEPTPVVGVPDHGD